MMAENQTGRANRGRPYDRLGFWIALITPFLVLTVLAVGATVGLVSILHKIWTALFGG